MSSLTKLRAIRVLWLVALRLPLTIGAIAGWGRIPAIAQETPNLAKGPVTVVTPTRDGSNLVWADRDKIVMGRVDSNPSAQTLPHRLGRVHDLAFSPDFRFLFASGGLPGQEGSLEVWNWPDRTATHFWKIHQDTIYRVVPSAKGEFLATASHDGLCCIVNAKTGAAQTWYRGHSRPVLALLILPGDQMVVSAGADQTIQVWDPENGKTLRTLDNHSGTIVDLALSPKPKSSIPLMASVGEDKTVRLWQPTIGRMIRFEKLNFTPRAITWNTQGDRLALGGDEGSLVVLDAETLQVQTRKQPGVGRILSLTQSADGKGLICGGSTGIALASW